MKKKIIITGGCGFIGSNLVQYLYRIGSYDITIIDNLSTGYVKYLNSLKNIKIINADITNFKIINDLFNNCEIIIHLAALGSVIDSIKNPSINFKTNVLGTFNVLECARQKHVDKIIFASTGGAIVGNSSPPINEKSLPSPISPYGSSKLCGEAYCSSFSSAYKMNIIALRFSNIIGPYSYHKNGIIQKYFSAIKSNDGLIVYGDGTASRDYLHVIDVCRAITLIIEKNINNYNLFHLSSGKETTINQLIALVTKVCNLENPLIKYFPDRPGEIYRTFANNNLAKTAFGFQPTLSLFKAIEDAWISFSHYSK